MISVIIPYNKDRGFLSYCINSIEAQSYRDYEIIQVKSDQSVAKNFNVGLQQAKGEFCKFVCEDDWLPTDSLLHLSNAIKGEFWVCANAEQHENGDTWIYKPDSLTFHDNLSRNRIHGGTTLYRTKLLRDIGGMNEDLWTGEEYDMHLKLMSMKFMPGYIDQVVYCHRLWSGQKSKILRKTRKDERQKEISRIQSLYFDKI